MNCVPVLVHWEYACVPLCHKVQELNLMKSILLLWFPAIRGLYPHKLATAWMRVLLTFLMSCFSWVLANIMTEFPCWFWKLGMQIFVSVPIFWVDYCKTAGSWWSHLGRMTGSNCHSFWWWWSDTLWVSLTRLWSYLFLSFSFWFCWNAHNCCTILILKALLWVFLCNLMYLCDGFVQVLLRFLCRTCRYTSPNAKEWYNHSWTNLWLYHTSPNAF